jgi:Aldo/keto reductase family
MLAQLGAPAYVLPGNRDDRDTLRRHFELRGAMGTPVQYAVDLGLLRLVVLDSTLPGEDRGELDAARLRWLDAELAGASDRPTLVALHHPPVSTGIAAWDEIGLPVADRRALAEVLHRHRQVRRVIAGHVHRTMTAELAGRARPTCDLANATKRSQRKGAPSDVRACSRPLRADDLSPIRTQWLATACDLVRALAELRTRRPLDTSREIVRRAFDLGITHFDLANNYGPPYGSAEENFGRLMHDDLRPYRDELVISSKAGYDMWPRPYGEWGSRKYLLASLDLSLRRMGLEYVDIFYSHRFDPETPLEETLGAVASAVQQVRRCTSASRRTRPRRRARRLRSSRSCASPC